MKLNIQFFVNEHLDKRVTFTKIKHIVFYLKDNRQFLKERALFFMWHYLLRFRFSTKKKIAYTIMLSLTATVFLGTFHEAIFTYEGLLFFHENNLPFITIYPITDVSSSLVMLAFKYFLFYRTFNVLVIYYFLKEIRLLPLPLEIMLLHDNLMKAYLSSIFFPFVGPWLLLTSEKEEYYYYLYKYKITLVLHFFYRSLLIPFATLALIFFLTLIYTSFSLCFLYYCIVLFFNRVFFISIMCVFILFLFILKWEEYLNK